MMSATTTPARTAGDRIAITLGILAFLYAGSWVMLPGLDTNALPDTGHPAIGSSMIPRLSIMALGAVPLVSAAIFIEMLRMISQRIRRALPGDIEDGNLKLSIYFLALALTIVQARGVAIGVEAIPNLVVEPGPLFRNKILLVFVAATTAHAYAAHLIDREGLGSGLWLVSALSLITSLPVLALVTLEMTATQGLEVGLAPVVFAAVTIGVTLGLISKDRTLLTSGTLVWSAVVTPAALTVLILPLMIPAVIAALLVWSGLAVEGHTGLEGAAAQALKMIEAMSSLPALTLSIAMPLLLVVVMLLRDRSLSKAGLPASGTTLTAALILATLTGIGLYARAALGTAIRLDALALVMLTALAAQVAIRLRDLLQASP